MYIHKHRFPKFLMLKLDSYTFRIGHGLLTVMALIFFIEASGFCFIDLRPIFFYLKVITKSLFIQKYGFIQCLIDAFFLLFYCCKQGFDDCFYIGILTTGIYIGLIFQ